MNERGIDVTSSARNTAKDRRARSDTSPVSGGVRMVTPELAASWLQTNEHNRPLSPSFVSFLVGAIQRGEWQLNGEPVIFSASGRLLDGQHRLEALRVAGVPLPMFVIEGVAEDAQLTMDDGMRRSAADHLAMEGVGDYTLLASALRVLQMWEDDAMYYRRSERLSKARAMDLLDRHPRVRDSIPVGARVGGMGIGYPKSVAAALHYGLSAHDVDATHDLFAGLVFGEGLYRGDPALTLRNTVARERARQGSTGRGLEQTWTIAVTLRAWHAQIRNEELRVIRLPGDRARWPRIPELHPSKGDTK